MRAVPDHYVWTQVASLPKWNSSPVPERSVFARGGCALSGGRVSRSLNALAHSLGPVAAGPVRVGPVPTESGFR